MVVHSYLFPHAAWTEEQMSVSDRCSSIVDIVDAVLGAASRRTRKHFQVAEYPFTKVGHKHYSGCMENRPSPHSAVIHVPCLGRGTSGFVAVMLYGQPSEIPNLVLF